MECAGEAIVSLKVWLQGLEKNFDYKKVLKAFKKGTLPRRKSKDADLKERNME